jgi:hypothetical protein
LSRYRAGTSGFDASESSIPAHQHRVARVTSSRRHNSDLGVGKLALSDLASKLEHRLPEEAIAVKLARRQLATVWAQPEVTTGLDPLPAIDGV